MSTIFFTPRAMALLQAYVNLSEGEVSGIGKVERLGSDFLVTEILLLEQESSWASTELDLNALARFLEGLLERGEDPSAYKLWWHSHSEAEVFWSVTDDETCQGFNNRWMLSVVINKVGDLLGRIDVYEPIHLTSELPVKVYTPLAEEELEAIKEELAQKVRRKAWSYGRRWPWSWRGWGEGEGEEEQDQALKQDEGGKEGSWTS